MSSTSLFHRIAIDANLVWSNRKNRFYSKRELTYTKQCGKCATAHLTAVYGNYVCIFRCNDSFFNITDIGAFQVTYQLLRLLFDVFVGIF